MVDDMLQRGGHKKAAGDHLASKRVLGFKTERRQRDVFNIGAVRQRARKESFENVSNA
jgi:hypothetical protein